MFTFFNRNGFGPPNTTPQLTPTMQPTANEFGLTILVEPTVRRGGPVVNIVFVHGLGGSAKGTWTHPGTDSFWPPWLTEIETLQNARIITFGYDSEWTKIWKPDNVLGISDFSDQLLVDILQLDPKVRDVKLISMYLANCRTPRYLWRIVWEAW